MEQARMLMADLLGGAGKPNLEDLSRVPDIGRAEHEQAAGTGGRRWLARRLCDGWRVDVRGDPDHRMGDERSEQKRKDHPDLSLVASKPACRRPGAIRGRTWHTGRRHTALDGRGCVA